MVDLEIGLEITPGDLFFDRTHIAFTGYRRDVVEIEEGHRRVEVRNDPAVGVASRLACITQFEQLGQIPRDRRAIGSGCAGEGRAILAVTPRALCEVVELTVERPARQAQSAGGLPIEIERDGLELVLDRTRAIAEFRQLEIARIGHIRTECEYRKFHIGVVVAVGPVAIIENDRGFDRDGRVGLGEAREQRGAEIVAERLLDGTRNLVEIGFAFAVIALVADPRILEIGTDDVVVAIDDIVREVDFVLVRTQQDFTPILVAVFLEVGIERVELDIGAIRRAELDCRGRAKAFAVVIDQAVARDARVESVAHFHTSGIGSIGGAIDAIDRTEGRIIRPADRVVAQFGRLVFGPGSRCGDTEGFVRIAPRQQAGETRCDVVVQVIVASLRRTDELETRTIRKRIAGIEVDDRPQRTFVERCRRGLVDHDRIEQFRREDVEIESAVPVKRCAVDRGRDRFHSVDAHASELSAQPANRDLAPLARIAFDRDARNTLERFGKIGIGEFGDVLGHDDIDLADRLALRRNGRVERLAEARYDDHIITIGNLARCVGSDIAYFVIVERARILGHCWRRKNQCATGQQSRLHASRGNHKPHRILLSIGTGVFLEEKICGSLPHPPSDTPISLNPARLVTGVNSS